MKKSQDLFSFTEKIIQKIKLKKNADFIVIDIHGEITSEKMALGHFLDGKVTTVVGTHTHVPTSDTKILKNGTAYQTDLGMCGDYDSVIGMNKENSIKKFKKDPSAESHFPANGNASISGVIVDADDKTGLAKNIKSDNRRWKFKSKNFKWLDIRIGLVSNIKRGDKIKYDLNFFQNYLEKLLLLLN